LDTAWPSLLGAVVVAPVVTAAVTGQIDVRDYLAKNDAPVSPDRPLPRGRPHMTTPRFDPTPFLGQDEGQHFDRKSLFEGPEGAKRARDRRAVRDQVAEYVAAFANAEGGVLMLGVEDDGTVTGHALPAKALSSLLSTPRTRLQPPQPDGFVVEVQGKPVVVYDVPASDVPVQVVGDGFPLRMGDRTVQATETQITALKFRGLAESWEARPSPLAVDDLDPDLLARARTGAGYTDLSDEEYLLKRKLADRRGSGLVLRRAAELLFAMHGPDHPNAGVRVFRVIGGERRFGVEHNVEERPRIEGNLAQVLDEAFTVIGSLIRRPSRLRGTRFQPVPEYPEFSWKEAVLNAVAHRDYSVEGRTTEVWFFDDRLEITSPGGLSPDVTLDELLRGERRHVSRNPRIVRGLVDLGSMRDQGEGIPRMFAEMAGQFLPDPRSGRVRATSRSRCGTRPSSPPRTAISWLDSATLTWVTRSSARCSMPGAAAAWTTPGCARSPASTPSAPACSCAGFATGACSTCTRPLRRASTPCPTRSRRDRGERQRIGGRSTPIGGRSTPIGGRSTPIGGS
jgi:ATP-dependent DNA helicase RecG